MGESRIQAGAAAFLAFAAALHVLVTPDLWWHLAAGRWILENRSVPRFDVLTWTIPDRPWIDLQWLGDVLLASGWRWAGPEGVVLGKAIAFAGVAALVVAAARAAGAGAAAAGLATGLAVLASAERTLARPEIATYLGLGLTLLAVHRVRSGRRAWAFVPPAVTIAWANLHALAFLGPATVLLHAGLAALERRFPDRPDREGDAGTAARDLALSGAAAGVALLANPYGIAAWTFPLTLLRRIDGAHAVFGRILEFSRPLDDAGDPILRPFWILLAVTVLSLFAGGRRFPLGRALSVLPFLALALLARRNVPLAAWTMAPVLAVGLTELARRRGGGSEGRARNRAGRLLPAAAAIALGLALLGGASPGLLGLSRDRGLAVAPGLFPEESLAALDASGPAERLFHDLDFGGYLVWRDPARRSFIDGRLEVSGPEWFERFVRAHEDPAAWERLQSSWDFDALLLEHSAAGSAAFLRSLVRSGEWEAVHLSAEAALLRRSGPPDGGRPRTGAPAGLPRDPDDWARILGENRGPAPHAGRALAFLGPLHDRLAGAPSPAAVRRAVRLANLALTLDRPRLAREGYEAVLAVAPRDVEAWVNLGLAHLREGNDAAARKVWGEARERVRGRDRAAVDRALERLDGSSGPGAG